MPKMLQKNMFNMQKVRYECTRRVSEIDFTGHDTDVRIL